VIALDATVVRPPYSGVQYAVRSQALAWQQLHPQDAIFASNSELRAHTPSLPARLRSPHWRILWQQSQLPRLLKSHAAEHLLALAYTAPLRCPVPYTLEVHDTIALRRPELCSRLNALHMRCLMPRAIRGARHIITAASAEADHIMRIAGVPTSRIHRVPLALDPIFLRTPQAAAERPPYLLFVGNIEPKKGLGTLLDAFAEFADLDLILVGRAGWKCKALLARVANTPRVHWLGRVPREALLALYAGACAFVFPSIEEGFGLPLLEAMALGTPVIHSDLPVLAESANGFGQEFPVGNAPALASAIRDSLSNTETATAQAWAREQTWAQWAESVAEIVGSAGVGGGGA
jgi:glycosyltransferase involved in cell wall biosynthesis